MFGRTSGAAAARGSQVVAMGVTKTSTPDGTISRSATSVSGASSAWSPPSRGGRLHAAPEHGEEAVDRVPVNRRESYRNVAVR